MRLSYEPTKDVLTVTLRPGASVVDIAEDAAGTVFAYDEHGELVSIQIFDATRNLDRVRDIERIAGRLAERFLRDEILD